MGVYRYEHEWCGFEQDIFLENETRNTLTVTCYRCGRNVSARLVRDKSIKLGSADGTTGILRKNEKHTQNRRRGENRDVR